VAHAAFLLGMFSVSACVLGPVGVQIGVAPPMAGFGIFGFGLLCGLLAIFTGLGGLWTTRATAARTGRGRAIAGIGFGLLVIGVAAFARSDADSRATFNDITTDLTNAPEFQNAPTIDANQGRDMTYTGEFSAQQRELYPDLAPIELSADPTAAGARVEQAGSELGWELTSRHETLGLFEFTQTSRVFRFVDDIVVRVSPAPGGSVIDVRSKSRDGVGDMGVNATRIRAFREALEG